MSRFNSFVILLDITFFLFILVMYFFDGIPRGQTLIHFMSITPTMLTLYIWSLAWVVSSTPNSEIPSSLSSSDVLSFGRVFQLFFSFWERKRVSLMGCILFFPKYFSWFAIFYTIMLNLRSLSLSLASSDSR